MGPIANPHPPPQSPTLGHTLAAERNFFSIVFLSFICDNTPKVWYRTL